MAEYKPLRIPMAPTPSELMAQGYDFNEVHAYRPPSVSVTPELDQFERHTQNKPVRLYRFDSRGRIVGIY